MKLLAVINLSTRVNQSDVGKAVTACAIQLRLHVAPIWDMAPAVVCLFADERAVPVGVDRLILFDHAAHAEGLGYHRVTPSGQPYGRLFVDPILDHDGTATNGATSVSVIMSHETSEWFVDRYLNYWAEGPEGFYAVEICDPVEDSAYTISDVSVSNFVTPEYFHREPPGNAELDYLKVLTRPFMLTPGGYVQVSKNGKMSPIFGDAFPEWRKELKLDLNARLSRRVGQESGGK